MDFFQSVFNVSRESGIFCGGGPPRTQNDDIVACFYHPAYAWKGKPRASDRFIEPSPNQIPRHGSFSDFFGNNARETVMAAAVRQQSKLKKASVQTSTLLQYVLNPKPPSDSEFMI